MNDKTILIIEDDADVRIGYQVLLKANHYDTFLAADASFAVTVARNHAGFDYPGLGSARRWRLHRVGEVPSEQVPLYDPCHRGVRARRSWKQGTRAKGGGRGFCAEAVERPCVAGAHRPATRRAVQTCSNGVRLGDIE